MYLKSIHNRIINAEYVYTVMAKNISTLCQYDQSALFIPLIFFILKEKSQKSNLSLDNKNLKWEKISWNKCFS